ncbi:uncharacterized protein LOC134006314 [Scomber scombrus]|uniref:uncharacterized protein LOC134006314 n=1 Tax=Scomber scombrus TaxID=13677 RepID=UPI002DDAEA88|nr:uncharacterized protein LOC134006314 [Scomber scombrus]
MSNYSLTASKVYSCNIFSQGQHDLDPRRSDLLCLWEKMICRILLLISLTSCVSGTFVVKVTQTSYQAEENHNITLEWMFTTKPDSSSTSLNIFCRLITDHNDPVLYHVHEGVEAPESQDEQFAGRVHSDKDALREGRIRLHVSRLRTNDSGWYTCDVITNDGVSSDRCLLNITGRFVVKVTQTSYQAEENHNITLEWMFTTKPDSSSTSLNIYCEMMNVNNKHPVLYHVIEGVEVPESQEEQIAGRVQCDKDALREGRIRLHVSRLRTEDSGLYTCDVKTDDGVSSDRCLLNVTAAVDKPEPQKPTERPQPESWDRIGLYVGLIAAGLAVCAGLFVFRLCSNPDVREHAVEHELENMDAAE